MADKISEGYFLTPVEYAVLLAGAGMKEFYTLQSENVEINKREICLAMNHLYQTGLVDSEDEKFVVREGLEELIHGIRQADYAVFIRSGRQEEKAVCSFHTEKGFIATQFSQVDKDFYKIYEISEPELTEKVMEEMVMIQNYEPVLDEEIMYQKMKESRKSISKENIRRYHNLALVVEKLELKSGTVEKKALVRVTADGKYIDMIEKGKSAAMQAGCEEENVKQMMQWLMEGK